MGTNCPVQLLLKFSHALTQLFHFAHFLLTSKESPKFLFSVCQRNTGNMNFETMRLSIEANQLILMQLELA